MSDLTRLPADPVGFFELADGYDRRDLKRAYGKAIRQYKPETHPNEFRLIRDAYEQLEQALRYGRKQKEYADAAGAWETVKPRSTPVPDRTSGSQSHDEISGRTEGSNVSVRPASPPSEPTLRELALADPAATLKKLQAKKRRSAQDFYLTAVLTDAISGRPTTRYLGHLIDGLVAYPSDPGLTVLAMEYMRVEVPDELAGKVVRHVASKIRSPLFYMLTEPVWTRLTETQPFDQVEKLLRTCERDVQQTDPAVRTTFYLRFLRTAIWSAKPEWTDNVLAEIESKSASLDEASQGDLEFLVEINQLLRAHRDSGINDPVKEKLLTAFRTACRADEGAATAEVIRTLSEVAKDASGVQQAFPAVASEEDSSWVTLTYTLLHQLHSYLDERERLPNERITTQTVNLLADLEPTEPQVSSSYQRAQWRYKTVPLIGWLIVGTIFLATPLVSISMLFTRGNGGLLALGEILVLFVGLVVVFYRWLYPKYLQPREERMHREWAMRDYEKHWRARLFRFAQSIGAPMDSQLVFIEAICHKTRRLSLGRTVGQFVRQDPGLCIYAGLQSLL